MERERLNLNPLDNTKLAPMAAKAGMVLALVGASLGYNSDKAEASLANGGTPNAVDCTPGGFDPVESTYVPATGPVSGDTPADIQGTDDSYVWSRACNGPDSATATCTGQGATTVFAYGPNFSSDSSDRYYKCDKAATTLDIAPPPQNPVIPPSGATPRSDEECINAALAQPSIGGGYKRGSLRKYRAKIGLNALAGCEGTRTVVVYQEIERMPGKFARNSGRRTIRGNDAVAKNLTFNTHRKYTCEGKPGERDGTRRVGTVARVSYWLKGQQYVAEKPYHARSAETTASAKAGQSAGC